MENSNIGLQDPPPLSRKRKRSSANGDSVFKCRFCPKKFENESLVSLIAFYPQIKVLVKLSHTRLSIDKDTFVRALWKTL